MKGRTHSEPRSEADAVAVAAIGASAGGLEAFTALLRALPNNTGLAFVFIQHLDPTHLSMLSELLAKSTSMPVLTVKNGTKVEPNHVYVIPPNVNMGIAKRRLRLWPRSAGHAPHMPIDFFMKSLAEARNSRSVGVVLSGTASDGTRGLAAIKAEGGVTFAQDERSAKYSGMPHSAIASGSVDFVLPPGEIARELGRISGHPYLSQRGAHGEPAISGKSGAVEPGFLRIFALLRRAYGINFSQYKSGTVERRTLRRMMLHKMERVSDYGKYLEKHPDETESLRQDLLIPVTSFFRNPQAFEILKSKVFPAILKDKSTEGTIRIWAAGTSTGEETYSLAFALHECLGDRIASLDIRIFGTDANGRAIAKARAGIYEERISHEVSPERLRRFFTKVDEGYRVSKQVRDLCVFATQNLAEDPPFSQMNLIACRNLLIYFAPELQRKVVPILHYALRPAGFLMLGHSESAAGFPGLFAPFDKKHKIFVKKPVAARVHYDFSANRRPAQISAGGRIADRPPVALDSNQQLEADRIVLKGYAPAGLVINDNLEILQFRGAVGPYVEPASGKASLHLLKMARKELVAELQAALNQAKKSGGPVKRKSVEFRRNGQNKAVKISVHPLRPSTENRQYLILFEPALPSIKLPPNLAGKPGRAGRTGKAEIAQLRRKLSAAEEHLRSFFELKEASDEEYQAANEEILSANEELQSTNEELETSKEELQSANEELNTVNDELHTRNLDLDRLHNDLNNLLSSTTLPIVMVDRGLRIRRMTALAAETFKTLPSDIGRPISEIRLNIDVPELAKLIAGVIDSLTPMELEVQDKEHHWYSLQIRPYRTLDDRIDGAVLILSDIDAARQASERLKKSGEFMEDILGTIREPLLVLDERLKVLFSNPAFLNNFVTRREETEGELLYRLGNGQWNIPNLRTKLEEVIAKDISLRDFEVEHDFPALGTRTMLLNARRIAEGHGGEPMMLLAIEDITERKKAYGALLESEERYRTLFDLGPTAVYSCDASGAIRDFNARAAELWGRRPALDGAVERFSGSFKMYYPDGTFMPNEQCPTADVLSGKIPLARDMEVKIERPDGSQVAVIVNVRALTNERGEISGAISSFVDITGRSQAEEARSRLAAIVESSDDAIVGETLDGIVTSWNNGAERLFGYTAEEAIGRNITLIVPPDGLSEEAAILESVRRGDRVAHVDTVRVSKDGTALDVSLALSPVKNAHGRIVGVSKVARDITERKRAQQELERSHARLESAVEKRTASLRKLSYDLIRAQDEERQKIARELHDSTAQLLTALGMQLGVVETSGALAGHAKESQALAECQELATRAANEVRDLSHLLHPPDLDQIGLAAAIRWHAGKFSQRTGIAVKVDLPAKSARLPRDMETALFRVVQESLTNVQRHSGSTVASIRCSESSGYIRLEVRDEGRGVPPEMFSGMKISPELVGIGIAGMRERMRHLGGRLEVLAGDPGTIVRATVPYRRATRSKAGHRRAV